MDGLPQMQRFTLIHDGTKQGWQTAYLAFHIAALLGAPLLVLLDDSTTDQKNLFERVSQVKVGGRAAGVAINTLLVKDFSVETMAENVIDSDGLFIPHPLVPDEKTAIALLDVLSCPLWVVSQGIEAHKMGVLVNDLAIDMKLVTFTISLSSRLQQPLIGLIHDKLFTSLPQTDGEIDWIRLPDISLSEIVAVLEMNNIDTLFLPASNASLVKDLTSNCVLYPETKLDA